MNTLSGETIQELLFSEGLDFTYNTSSGEDYTAMDIQSGIDTLRLERLWSDDGKDWYLDEGDITITHIREGEVEDRYESSASSESELILELIDLHSKVS